MTSRTLPFTIQNFGFEIEVSDAKPVITDKQMIPMFSVVLRSTDEGENYSIQEIVREQRLSTVINKFRNRVAPEWVAAYDLKGSTPTKVDTLLTTLGFE